jgi:hypothetical protein
MPVMYILNKIYEMRPNLKIRKSSPVAMCTRTLLWIVLPVALLAVLLPPNAILAADPVFRGNLLVVTPGSISVRLPDGMVIDARLPKTGNLTAGFISTQYKVADQVEITCKRTEAFLDTKVDRYYALELKQVRFLHSPSPDEWAKSVASLSWHGADNLLKLPIASNPKPDSVAGEPSQLEHIREVNLANAAKMPNFVADEKATRFRGQAGSLKSRLEDVIESEVVFQGSDATRQRIRINGKAWKSKSSWLPGLNWGVAFGDDLKPALARNCVSEMAFKGPVEASSRQLFAYQFQSPPDGCFGPHTVLSGQFNPARTGQILVDGGGNVIQFEKTERGFPAGYGFSAESKEVVSWDYVKIGEVSYLLPVAADYLFTYSSGDVWHIEVQYKNHRHFESSIDLKFGEN